MATIVQRHNRDGELIGFQAKVRRGGVVRSKTFSKIVIENGKPVGPRQLAQRWARRIEGDVESGKIKPTRDADGDKPPPDTLDEALERYLAEVTPGKKGQVQETIRIKAWRRDPLATKRLANIRPKHIAMWRTQKVQKGQAPTTIKNALTIISQVFVTARSDWGLDDLTNPVRGVRMPKNRRGRARRFRDKNEEQKLYDACDDSHATWLGPLVRLAVETAMRLGELLALKRGDILQMMHGRDLVHVAHLPETKNGTARTVPLSPEAVAIVDKITPARDGRLFPVDIVAVENAWRAARKAAEMDDFRFHDLRHEGTSRLFERGLDAIEVATVTGHKTDHMLRRYTHFPAARIALKLASAPATTSRRATKRKHTRASA